MKFNWKTRPKFPEFAKLGESEGVIEAYRYCIERQEWDRSFEKEIRETPLKDLVGTPNPYENFDDAEPEAQAYRKGFSEGILALIGVILGETDKDILMELKP